MNAVISIILLAVALGVIVLLLTRRENTRRSQYGPAGLSEFRTDLPLDECFDRLDLHSETDEFAYECRRENDGTRRQTRRCRCADPAGRSSRPSAGRCGTRSDPTARIGCGVCFRGGSAGR